jgi:hypothetical protein
VTDYQAKPVVRVGVVHYCDNGCATNKQPRITEPPSRICRRCEDELNKWLTAIPDIYALLPQFRDHGTTDSNPESKTTKAAEAPAPMRLEVIDLLDERLGRIWQGTAPAHDRRGVIGTLQAHVERLLEERNQPIPNNLTVSSACAILNRHRLWLAEQIWISDLHKEIKTTHRAMSDAIGDYRPRPVGRCHIDTEDGEACGGGLYANPYGGVRCSKCAATWDAEHLRQLGLAQAAVNN